MTQEQCVCHRWAQEYPEDIPDGGHHSKCPERHSDDCDCMMCQFTEAMKERGVHDQAQAAQDFIHKAFDMAAKMVYAGVPDIEDPVQLGQLTTAVSFLKHLLDQGLTDENREMNDRNAALMVQDTASMFGGSQTQALMALRHIGSRKIVEGVFETLARNTEEKMKEQPFGETKVALAKSDRWDEKMRSYPDPVFQRVGPIDMDDWDPIDHQEAKAWANGDQPSMPQVLQSYIDKLDEAAQEYKKEQN